MTNLSDARSALLESVAAQIVATHLGHPVRVAIDGPDGAGKTVFADELADFVRRTRRPVIRASIDRFHRPREERSRRGELSPIGYFEDSFDYDALCSLLLVPLGPKGDRRYKTSVFDCKRDVPLDTPAEIADPAAVLLMDGVFLLRWELQAMWDFAIFLRCSEQEVLRRVAVRDQMHFGNADAVIERYRRRYIPGQRIYFRQAEPWKLSNVVIDNTSPDAPVFDGAARSGY